MLINIILSNYEEWARNTNSTGAGRRACLLCIQIKFGSSVAKNRRRLSRSTLICITDFGGEYLSSPRVLPATWELRGLGSGTSARSQSNCLLSIKQFPPWVPPCIPHAPDPYAGRTCPAQLICSKPCTILWIALLLLLLPPSLKRGPL